MSVVSAGLSDPWYGPQIWIRVSGVAPIWVSVLVESAKPGQKVVYFLPPTCVRSHSISPPLQPFPLWWRVASKPASDALL